MKFKFSNRTVCAVLGRNIKRRVTLTGVDVRNPCFATKHCVNYTGSEQVASMASSKDNNSNNEAQESLLYSARHGELSVVKAMLEAKDEGKLTLDINCKGKNIYECNGKPVSKEDCLLRYRYCLVKEK